MKEHAVVRRIIAWHRDRKARIVKAHRILAELERDGILTIVKKG